MMRTLISIPDDDIRWLDKQAVEQGRSRAAVVREAVSAYRAKARNDALESGFGLWKDRTDIGDSVEWQRRERASWTRPWDDDYEEVKADFPDLFDEQDDRERAHYLALSAKQQDQGNRRAALASTPISSSTRFWV